MIDQEFTKDATLLADIVRDAGRLALSMWRTELKNWTKGVSSPVSEADIAVNDLLEKALRSATPDYGWLSEESADDAQRLDRRLVWIVDPIDGTRAYLAGREDWCVSVALVEQASPVLAAVFAPASEEFFFAIRGKGATLNGLSVQATTGTDIDFTTRRRAEAFGRTLEQCDGRWDHAPSAHRFAGAAAVPGRGRESRCRVCRRPESRLGSCRSEFDRAGSEW